MVQGGEDAHESADRAGDRRSATLDADAEGTRFDRALAAIFPDLSRSRLQALIREGAVRCDGAALLDPSRKVAAGMQVELLVPAAAAPEPRAEALPLVVVHEDDDLLVIDKPAGLVVHPAPGHESGTLVNALIAHCGDSLSGIGGVRRPGIVHRLDRDTSGLLVIAKNDLAHRGLSAQFAAHGRDGLLERSYRALVWGVPEPRRGTIRASLARSQRNREKIAVVREGEGREAVTHYRVEEVLGGDGLVALVNCTLETGRTHQIRVHLSHVGHALLGDDVYGSAFKTKASKLSDEGRAKLVALHRQALHAATLGFQHPRTQEPMRFESALPTDLTALLASLRDGAD